MGNDSRRSLHLAGSPTSFRSTDQGRRECAVPLVSSPGLVAVPHGVGASTSGGKVGNSVTRGRRSRGMASPLLAASLAIILAAVPCASFSPATSSLGNFKGLSVAHSSATRTSGRARGARRWREGHGAAPGVCVSMGLFGWGDKKKDGDKEEPRDGEERLRWQSAITQAGTHGLGATEEERAEAARLRRAALVAQDPTYVTKRLSDETRESLPQAGGSPPPPPSSSPPAASPPPQQQQQAQEPVAPPADKPKPGSKEMWYKSETYSRLQKKLDGTVAGEARAQGGWGELPEQETPEQAAEREDRQRKLREDAARTLGDRAKYFEGKDSRKDGAINRSADAGREASPPQSGEASAPSGGGGLYRNRFQEESEKRLRSILPDNSKSSLSPKPASSPGFPPPSPSSPSGPGVWETMLTLKEQRGDAKGGSAVGSAGGGNDGGEASNTGGYNLEDLPVIGDEVDEYQNGKTTKWKVIAPDGIVVLAGPGDGEAPIGRLKRMQAVDVEREALPWVKISEVDGWIRVSGGKRGREIYLVRQGKTLGFDDAEMEKKWGKKG